MNAILMFETTDYDRFTLDPLNRPVTPNPKLAASLAAHGFIPAHPLHVVERDGKLVVIDGQHRLAESRKLGIPVHYVICPDAKVSIPLINSAQKGWKPSDYATSFADQGKKEYMALKSFQEKSGFPLMVSAVLLAGYTQNGNIHRSLRDGSFSVSRADIAWRVVTIERAISESVNWSKHAVFLFALAKCCLVEEFKDELLIHKFQTFGGLLKKQVNTQGYIDMIESIYNRQSHDKIPLAHLVELIMLARGRSEQKEEE